MCISEGFVWYKWINDSVSLYFGERVSECALMYVTGFILPKIGNHTQATSSDIQTKWLIKLYYLLNKSLAVFIVCIAHPHSRRKTQIAVPSPVLIQSRSKHTRTNTAVIYSQFINKSGHINGFNETLLLRKQILVAAAAAGCGASGVVIAHTIVCSTLTNTHTNKQPHTQLLK